MVNANSMSEEQILEKFREIVARSLRIDPATVNPECTLDEPGAESLDLIEITMETEAEFNIWLPEKPIFATAEEIFGHDVLQTNGPPHRQGFVPAPLAESRTIPDGRRGHGTGAPEVFPEGRDMDPHD